MTKLINLDELAGVARSVKYKGVNYEVNDLSLLDFVKAQKAVDGLSKAFDERDYITVVEGAITVCGLAVPTLAADLIRSMGMNQIMALVQCVMDIYPDTQKEVKSAAAVNPAAADVATDKAGNA